MLPSLNLIKQTLTRPELHYGIRQKSEKKVLVTNIMSQTEECTDGRGPVRTLRVMIILLVTLWKLFGSALVCASLVTSSGPPI